MCQNVLTKWLAFMCLHGSVDAKGIEGVQPRLVHGAEDGKRHDYVPASLFVLLAEVEQ